MRRRPDSTTRWLLKDQQSSGLSLDAYERRHGLVFEELPLPSPATQRIRRHEKALGDMDGSDTIAPRKDVMRLPRSEEPRGTMSPEMAAARRAFYEAEAMVGSGLSCATCGERIPDERFDTRITCARCHREILDLAGDL